MEHFSQSSGGVANGLPADNYELALSVVNAMAGICYGKWQEAREFKFGDADVLESEYLRMCNLRDRLAKLSKDELQGVINDVGVKVKNFRDKLISTAA